jgi:peroxiredoxin
MRKTAAVCVLVSALAVAFGSATGIARELLKKGDDIPGFVIKDLNGQPFFLKEHIGGKAKYAHKALLFSFCQSTCKPCRKEVPELEKTMKKFERQGLAMFLVNVGENEKTARDLANELKTSIPFLVDRFGIVFKLVGGTATPLTILVDGAGKVQYVRPGFSEEKAEEIVAELESTIAGVVGAGSGAPSR